MPSQSEQVVESVFPQVLQQAAYAFGEPCPPGELAFPENGLLGHIRFSGSAVGEVFLAMPASLAAELAANILGLDSGCDEAQAQAKDAFSEFLNVICGNLLAAWAGPQPVFDLQAPQVEGLTPAAWQRLGDDSLGRAFLVDGVHPVLLKFSVN